MKGIIHDLMVAYYYCSRLAVRPAGHSQIACLCCEPPGGPVPRKFMAGLALPCAAAAAHSMQQHLDGMACHAMPEPREACSRCAVAHGHGVYCAASLENASELAAVL